MPAHPVERHNEEFKMLFDRHVASLGEDTENAVRTAMEQAGDMLGVNPETIKSYRRPEGGRSANACPKWRVDMYRVALPPEVSRIADTTRDEIISGLRYLRGSGVMSEETIRAFDNLVRRHSRRAAQ